MAIVRVTTVAVGLKKEKDITYHTDFFNSVAIEPGLAIIIACCPLLRPLFEKVLPVGAISKRKRRNGSIPPFVNQAVNCRQLPC